MNGIYFVEPVAWTPTEAIQSLEKKPVFVLGCIRVTRGGSDKSCFLSLSRKNAWAECVFVITLFEGPTNQVSETVKPENGRETVAF